MRLISFLILFFSTNAWSSLINQGHNQCNSIDIDLSTLNFGEVKYINWQGSKIGIYRLTKADLEDMKKSSASNVDSYVPSWWPLADRPVNFNMKSVKDSVEKGGTSVFWSFSPISGCEVVHFPAYTRSKEPGKTPAFVGTSWGGGVVDFCSMSAFDYSGRYVAYDAGFKVDKSYKASSLLVPPFTINSNRLTLQCKP
jgi:hypothetical protein